MRRRSTLFAAVLAAFSVLASSGVAFADEVQGGEIELVVTALCVGQSTTVVESFPLVRSATGPQFSDGDTVTLSPNSIAQPPNATVEIVVTHPSILLPSDWTSQPLGTVSSDSYTVETMITGTSVGSEVSLIEWQVAFDGGHQLVDRPVSVDTIDCGPTPTPTTGTPTPPPFSIQCGGSITVSNFADANVDAAPVFNADEPDGEAPDPVAVIDADGVYPLEPGDYVAFGVIDGQQVTATVEFTIEACPVGPTPTPPATADPTLSLPDTAAVVEAGPRPPSGGSVALVLAVLAGIAGTTTMLTVRRVRRR